MSTTPKQILSTTDQQQETLTAVAIGPRKSAGRSREGFFLDFLKMARPGTASLRPVVTTAAIRFEVGPSNVKAGSE